MWLMESAATPSARHMGCAVIDDLHTITQLCNQLHSSRRWWRQLTRPVDMFCLHPLSLPHAQSAKPSTSLSSDVVSAIQYRLERLLLDADACVRQPLLVQRLRAQKISAGAMACGRPVNVKPQRVMAHGRRDTCR